MKRILLLTILSLIFCWQGFGQQESNRPVIYACEVVNVHSSLEDHLARILNLTFFVHHEKGSTGVVIYKFTNLSEKKKVVVRKRQLLKILKKRKVSLDGIEIKIERGKVFELTTEFIPPPTN